MFLLLAIGLTSFSSADYLDDWSDKDLCGWMDNPSPPSYYATDPCGEGKQPDNASC